MLAAEVSGTVIVAALSAAITGLVGLLSYLNARQTAAGSSTKDIIESSAIARKDLVDEVARLAAAQDVYEHRLADMTNAHAREIADLRAQAERDRADCDRSLSVLRTERDAELAWSARLVASLRDAGLSVPARSEGAAT